MSTSSDAGPALDPLGILNETVGDITGYELPNLVELGVGTITGDMPSFQTEKQNAYDTATNLLTTTAEELPFIGGVLGADAFHQQRAAGLGQPAEDRNERHMEHGKEAGDCR